MASVAESEADQEAVTATLLEEAPASDLSGPAAEPGVDAGAASEDLSEEAVELLAILASAVEEMGDELAARIEDIAHTGEPECRHDAALAAQEILVCLADASSQAGFLAFSSVCASLGYKIAAMPAETAWAQAHVEALRQLPERVQAYLFDPLAELTREALVELLALPHWTEPTTQGDAAELVAGLFREPLSLETEKGPLRPEQIEAEDLALDLAEDIDAAVVASFRREGPDLTNQLAIVLQKVIDGAGGEDDLRHAQRLAHTIKGSANVCGVRAIAVLGHHLEDLLEFLTDEELKPGPSLGDSLAAGADGLAIMFDVLNGVEAYDPDAFQAIMQEVLDWANRIDREGKAALADAAPAVEITPVETPPETEAEPGADRAPEVAAEPAAQTAPASETDQDEAYLQVPARTVEELLRLVGELSMALSQSEEQLGRAQRTLREASELDRRNLLHIAELEKLVDLRGLGTRGGQHSSAELEERFDPIELEQYNEMYINTRRLNEGVSDVRELTQTLDGTLRSMTELSLQQVKLSQQLRQLTMGTRLVAVSSVVPRLQRAVRQTCRTTGKQAELRVQGSDVRIDGDLLDRLMPAMMHMVRNAVDHGIESPEEREAAGKPRQGRMEVCFKQLGDQVEVTLSDDGRGLSLERIRAKAIDKGLIDDGADLTDQELAMLTMRAGFSTRDQVTQISGRGVGMDVVASTIRSLNGTLELDTEPGQGYRFTARMPASMLALYCLLVQCNEQLLAIPANEVRLAVLSDEGSVEETRDGWIFEHEEGRFPLTQLNKLMGLPGRDPDCRRQVVLLMNTEVGEQAVMVDALLEGRELVVMRLSPLVPRIPGLLSASILGDGRVVPIVELRALIRVASGADLSHLAAQDAGEEVRPPTVLIVDDSLSMRRLLSRLAEDGGFRPLTARDGMEAIQTLTRDAVDVLLVDMEMPQMNGLELTAHLRSKPETASLPIAMITSRSTEKHRRQALQAGVDEYFVKPYREDDVLDFLQQALEQVS
ncbi:response regulator [Thiorhodococcus minor]|uniref:Chemotaxis protein CheA n=1 Tax=Thiorhodococcus minor TaxID=57489 RepID=A0A6M0K328_9GAMM|nr:response regulator [Thiorhodococcus minor]